MYSEADKAQSARLRALPRTERYATYARLKQLQEEGQWLTNGEFLFIRDWDQWRFAKKCRRRRCRAAIYAKLQLINKVSGGGFSNLHKH